MTAFWVVGRGSVCVGWEGHENGDKCSTCGKVTKGQEPCYGVRIGTTEEDEEQILHLCRACAEPHLALKALVE